MRRAVFALVALACAQHSPAAAQQDAPVRAEQVVRVHAPAAGLRRPTIGTVVDVRGDTVMLQVAQPDPIRGGSMLQQRAVPLRDVYRMEVAAGSASRARGSVLGAAIGTGAGLAATALHMRFSARRRVDVPCEDTTPIPECPLIPKTRFVEYPRERIVGITLAGTVLGTAAGAVFSGRRWRHVYPVAPAAGSAPGGGMELGAALRF